MAHVFQNILPHRMPPCKTYIGSSDADDFAHKLLHWHDAGFMAEDGKVFDMGVARACAIKALKAGSSTYPCRP